MTTPKEYSEDRKRQILTSGRVSEHGSEPPSFPDFRKDESGNLYQPNHIPASTRRQYIFLSSVLLAYGAFGAWVDDIYIPGKRGPGVHFHGVPLWFLLGAMISAAANMISVVADHYDKRNNEVNYRRFARITEILGWILFTLGFVVDIIVFKSSIFHAGQ